MIIGKTIYEFIAFSINCHYTRIILRYGWKEQMKDIVPIIIKSLLMGIIVYVSTRYLQGWWPKVLVGVPLGILAYVIIAIISKDSSLKEIVQVIKETPLF